MLKRFRLALEEYKGLLATAQTQGADMEKAMNTQKFLYDYKYNKAKYLGDNMKKSVAELRSIITELYKQSTNPSMGEQFSKIMVNVRLLEEKYYDPSRSLPITEMIEKQLKPLEKDLFIQNEIAALESEAKPAKKEKQSKSERAEPEKSVQKSEELPEIRLPFLPKEIHDHIAADVNELEKTFNLKCYRSSVILCGRILETALHRKYFEITGKDALEKNPGIGLGKLVARLSEQNVSFDPGLMNQIHLINQVRISSVHVKKDLYKPNQYQTQAIVLYTLDVLHKMFGK